MILTVDDGEHLHFPAVELLRQANISYDGNADIACADGAILITPSDGLGLHDLE